MQQEMNHKRWAIVFWILTAICMAVIFSFSAKPAEESTQQSNVFVQWLLQLFGENEYWEFIVRKSAHCLEFTGLSLLMNTALYFTKNKKQFLWGIFGTSLYAVTDELHQLRIDGRSCQFTDWVIDTVGALLGAAAFAVLFAIIKAVMNKKNSKRTNK